ncbi:hypothetical protein F441_02548 [Phytophthora nicotianae CJ01A1]|uniref:Uncharacterized protein n=2 Tax=Phytophthora nicotianae TaxID=4792 RepID=W2QQM7_PHYN3|nr:hypothetical protein PPTG_07415 [Phytophthora nicotianae INRA-310]ETN15256.1 hypothetical protein PPTG_07415 [Phytophthora nicotianae INRA-310]ETP24470.1 hypothetical protein F441_02548 [Phytophthora nicotianae CJ01A1]
MAQGSGSYYDDYMRSNAMLKHCNEKSTKKLLTDRNAYISFLEVQLERVSAACLTTQTFEKRLAELESAQMANDQKLGSLSKVFRLNQEYVEQISQQAQSELAGHAAKVDAWMEKFSVELERQQPRMATLEEQFRQCQEYLPRLVETNDAALDGVRHQVQQEIEELKAQVFALETRIEDIHSSQAATERKVENLATHKLDKELALVRSSVSEKSFQLERTVAQLSKDLEQLVHQIDASWRAEASETADRYEACTGELQQRLNQLQQDLERGHSEVKDVLKKCLDTQHLLSGTVVALQSEVDGVKEAAASHKNNEIMSTAMEDLREKQITLKNALQLLQACALEAQQANEDRCSKLADRVAAAEDSFETRTDDLRRRMLAALEDVGDKLHQDADATTENTLLAARKETESQIGHVMEFSTTLENRLRILEYTVLSLETKVQRSRAISEELGQVGGSPPEIAVNSRKQLSDLDVISPGHKMQERSFDEHFYQQRIRELEERLHRKAQIEEEQRLLFPEREYSSKSSIASSGYISSFATDDLPRRTHSMLKKVHV